MYDSDTFCGTTISDSDSSESEVSHTVVEESYISLSWSFIISPKPSNGHQTSSSPSTKGECDDDEDYIEVHWEKTNVQIKSHWQKIRWN